MATNACPYCKQPVDDDRARNPSWPFCSRRCKTIDLGQWLDERYRIPSDGQGEGTEDESTAARPDVPPRREG
ncbi:MAG: DNA gyrase inhibitor YacG [Deltaproteobacteria bacterium]